jgi:hypothetical protein
VYADETVAHMRRHTPSVTRGSAAFSASDVVVVVAVAVVAVVVVIAAAVCRGGTSASSASLWKIETTRR